MHAIFILLQDTTESGGLPKAEKRDPKSVPVDPRNKVGIMQYILYYLIAAKYVHNTVSSRK